VPITMADDLTDDDGGLPAQPDPGVLRVALGQVPAMPSDSRTNLTSQVRWVHRAASQHVDLVVFPALSLTGYEMFLLSEGKLDLSLGDPIVEPLQGAAARLGLTVVTSAPLLVDGDRLLTSLAISPDGAVTVYAQQWLAPEEKAFFVPGSQAAVVMVRGRKVLLALGADAAEPAHIASTPADLYCVSGRWFGRTAMEAHLGERASRAGIPVLAANYAGWTGGNESCGASGAWGPDGRRLAGARGAGPELVLVDLPSLSA
jgi:5-aminopentanamidase